ncbi:MAG TPA: zf-HC2 domain-containing protein [Anaeromyxobacteraceae bacterium]|nr:zf-HC2 domain-containing protein [Anaeromyxobacteraceae bacterium]
MASCSAEWNERISAFRDGEADGDERRRVRAHLAACAACAASARDFEVLGARLRGMALTGAPAAPTPRAIRGARIRRTLALAAAALVVAGGSLVAVRIAWPSRFERTLAPDLERLHLRSFSRAEPCEFESSDPAAVAAWVERTLGYRAPVPEVAGATLLGARRCALDGEPTAHLLYRVEGRALTVFVPRDGTRADRAARGFAASGPRCTEGALGERVCVIPRDREVALAVSDAEPPALLARFAGLD